MWNTLLVTLLTATPSVPAAASAPANGAAAVPKGAQVMALPGGTPSVEMDYLAAERVGGRIWAPAGNTGKVDVIDVATGEVHAIDGFATADREMRGKHRVVGPSSVTIGDGFAYVGNRADSTVCAVDLKTLTKGACLKLATPPDGVCWIPGAKEVWVTTPKTNSLTILDAHVPGVPTKAAELSLDGKPEGYAVDASHGRFFTNLEDKDLTVTYDVTTRKEAGRWAAGCGADGPRGLAVDSGEHVLFVACGDHVISQDLEANGKKIAQLPTGAGVDNIDYLESQHRLAAAAGKDGKLTLAHSAHGLMVPERVVESAAGGRVVVIDGQGAAYVADSANGRLLRYAGP